MLEGLDKVEWNDPLAESVWAQVDGIDWLILKHLVSLDASSALAAVDMLAKNLVTQEHHDALRIAEVLLSMTFRSSISREDDLCFAQRTAAASAQAHRTKSECLDPNGGA